MHLNPLRQIPNRLPLCNCSRSSRYLLVMSPDPMAYRIQLLDILKTSFLGWVESQDSNARRTSYSVSKRRLAKLRTYSLQTNIWRVKNSF